MISANKCSIVIKSILPVFASHGMSNCLDGGHLLDAGKNSPVRQLAFNTLTDVRMVAER